MLTQYIAGFPWARAREAEAKISLLRRALDHTRPPVVQKNFTKKYCDIPTRSSYRGKFEDDFWKKFTKKELDLQPRSWICPDKLREVATMVGYEDKRNIDNIASVLANGANLGCRGSGRLATRKGNSPSAYEFGERLVDSLQGWLEDGLACGPLTEAEIREKIDWSIVTVNPMSVRLKPNGKARIIVDMSAPHIRDKEAKADTPNSVNSGIDKKEFPAFMAGTKDVLHLIYKVGREAEFCKADWNSAYKHIFVRPEDLPLQFLEFGGRYFMERALVFGCVSSPGIYDWITKAVIALAVLMAKVTADNVLQCLDDVVNISPIKSGDCGKFYNAYRDVCRTIGVSLAGEEDPSKAFPPCREGIVLGVHYNLENWMWKIPEGKVSYMMKTLYDITEGKVITVGEAMQLSGRLNHYFPLVPGGKWERGWLGSLAPSLNTPKHLELKPDGLVRSQAEWWIINMASTINWSPIPDIREISPADALVVYPDAAGGSDTNISLGLGGVVWTNKDKPWVYLPWPYNIRTDMKDEKGNKFARKLSMLEAAAALATVCANPDVVRNNNIRVASDNIGFVLATRKGNCRCKFTLTIIMALNHVAEGLNSGLEVVKTPRVSGPGEKVADHLSKGRFEDAFSEDPSFRAEPSFIPRTLISWLQKPVETRLLGQAILEEMSDYTEILRLSLESKEEVEKLVRRRKRKLSY